MARKGNVLQFRRPRKAKRLPPGPPRNGKFQLARNRRASFLSVRGLLIGLILVPLAFLGGIAMGENSAAPEEINYLPTLARPPAPEPVATVVASRNDKTRPGKAAPALISDKTSPAISVNWVDGDSGTIDGRAFRLYGVDAPEGSPYRAECNKEQRLSSNAREAVRKLTDGAEIEISRSHGIDKYDRELLTLRADGRDVATALVSAGHLKRWNYEAGDPKPDWCR